MPALTAYGYDAYFEKAFEPHAAAGFAPARVCAREGSLYRLWTEAGDRLAGLTGRYKHDLGRGAVFPAVGDWTAADLEPARAVIKAVLPRRSVVQRKEAGERDRMQVLAANVDVLFVVSGLDADFNPRRLERYLAIIRESGALAVILLNKADLCPDVESRLAAARVVSGDTPVHVMSAKGGEGVDALDGYLTAGRTLALLGSSGAGKSTLVNRILGDEKQATKGLRDDGRGRHTTTSREMFLTPTGAILMDTPGLREIQLADAAEGLKQTFEDVEGLFARCRFSNCRHHQEPGCAVIAALDSGTLDAERWESWLKLSHETGSRRLLDWQKRRLDRKYARVVDEALKRKGRK